MRVRYTLRALHDIIAIGDYIRAQNLSAAIKVERAIRDSVGLLSEFPQLGRERRKLGVRVLNVPRYSYAIYYRVHADEVLIIHVRDGRRRSLKPGEV